MVVHIFSGSKGGSILSRIFKDVGGNQKMFYELDKLHQESKLIR